RSINSRRGSARRFSLTADSIRESAALPSCRASARLMCAAPGAACELGCNTDTFLQRFRRISPAPLIQGGNSVAKDGPLTSPSISRKPALAPGLFGGYEAQF